MRRIVPFLGITLLLTGGCDRTPTALHDGPSLGVIGQDPPPVVTIYDINGVEIDQLTVDAGEHFTLIGFATGTEPLTRVWLQAEGGVLIAIGEGPNLIDYWIDSPGDYALVFGVTDGNGLTGSDEVAVTVLPVEAAPLEIEIDIKPGSDPNSINLGSNGNVPVAILSTPEFDATTVDPATVRLADAAVRVVGKKGNLQAALEDVNGDGLMDLIVHIDTEGLALTAGDVEAVLTGTTYDGSAIRGSDALQIVP